MSKNYREVMSLHTFEERLKYLEIGSLVGRETFGSRRYANQYFYKSPEWRRLRRDIILRDDGCDLAFPGLEIYDHIQIHHIVPITYEDIVNRDPKVLDPMNVICCSETTHKLIHYSSVDLSGPSIFAERSMYDTCPWKKK